MPSLPPVNPESSTAGIVHDHNGERVVPSTKRPDGTVRKEIRIRPGFTPMEDVARYRSNKQKDYEDRQTMKVAGAVPGMRPEVAQAKAAMMTKAQKRNEKRKVNRKDKKDGGADDDEEVPESWENDDDNVEAEGTEKEPTVSSEKKEDEAKQRDKERQKAGASRLFASATAAAMGSTKDDPEAEKEKRIKALQKKIRQAQQLAEKAKAGDTLLPEQQEKADSVSGFEQQLSDLMKGVSLDDSK